MTKEITGWEKEKNEILGEFNAGQAALLTQNGSVTLSAGEQREEGEYNCRDAQKAVERTEQFFLKAIASAVEAREREIQEYARKMRKDVDEGTYCNKQDGEWKNGYDCAMYDILLIINPSKE